MGRIDPTRSLVRVGEIGGYDHRRRRVLAEITATGAAHTTASGGALEIEGLIGGAGHKVPPAKTGQVGFGTARILLSGLYPARERESPAGASPCRRSPHHRSSRPILTSPNLYKGPPSAPRCWL